MMRPTHNYKPSVTVRNATSKPIAPWLAERQSTAPPRRETEQSARTTSSGEPSRG